MTRRTAYFLGASTLVAGALVLSGVKVLMVLGGLPLGLLLPGLALSAVLFRRPGRLVPIERIMLVPALSLGTLIVGGLLAWAVRAPLHRPTWLAVSAGVTLISLPFTAGSRESRPGPRLLPHVVPAALALVMLAGAAWLSLATSIRSHDVTVTTLSVVPPGRPDSSGDRAVKVNATGLSPGSYTLQVTSTSSNTSTAVVADENGLWTSTLRLPGDERLTLALYRAGETSPMRTVIVASAATG